MNCPDSYTELDHKSFLFVLMKLLTKLLLFNLNFIAPLVIVSIFWSLNHKMYSLISILCFIPLALGGLIFFDELGHVVYRFINAPLESRFGLKIRYIVLVPFSIIKIKVLNEASIYIEKRYANKFFFLSGFLSGLLYLLMLNIICFFYCDFSKTIIALFLTLFFLIISYFKSDADLFRTLRNEL